MCVQIFFFLARRDRQPAEFFFFEPGDFLLAAVEKKTMRVVGGFVRHIAAFERTAHLSLFKVKNVEQNFPYYIVISETNLIPTFDPRMEYTLVVDEKPDSTELALFPSEMKAQVAGTKSLEPCESGTARVYLARRIVSVLQTCPFVERRMLAAALPPYFRGKLSKDVALMTGYADVVSAAQAIPRFDGRELGLFLDLFADAFMPPEYVTLVQCGLARPKDLLTCAQPELVALAKFAAAQPTVSLPKLARWIEGLVPGFYHSLSPQCRGDADKVLSYARATRSTVLMDVKGLNRGVKLGAIRERGEKDKRRLLSWATDAAYEDAVAGWFTQQPQHCESVVVIPAVGRIDAILRPKLEAYGYRDFLVVAPTPGHAMATSLDAVSVHDLLAGRVQVSRRAATPVCFIFAHLFGMRLANFVLATIRPKKVILVGDPLFSYGSPHPGDRGCLLRDVAAAIRRDRIPGGTIDLLFGYSGCTADGCVTWEEHEALRSRSPVWPAAAVVGGEPEAEAASDWILAGSHKRQARGTYNGPMVCPEIGLLLSGDPEPVRDDPRNVAYSRPELQFPVPDGWDHIGCCGSPAWVQPAVHGGYWAQTVADVARVATGPVCDTLTVVCGPETGIEDVRAALLLARKKVFFTGDTDGLLERHSKRPMTAFLDTPGTTPLPDIQVGDAPSELIGAEWHLLGYVDRPAGTVAEFRASTIAYLKKDDDAAASAADDTATDYQFESGSPVYVFLEDDATPERLAGLTYKEVSVHVTARLAALHAAHPGLELELPALEYPPSDPALRDIEQWASDRAFLLRKREAFAVFILAKVFKDTPAQAWFLAAEEALFVQRGGSPGHARLHAKELRTFLAGPTLPLREPALDAPSFVAELWELRNSLLGVTD